MRRKKHDEAAYLATMTIARRMAQEGLLTAAEYEAFETEMKNKYQSLLGAFLFSSEAKSA